LSSNSSITIQLIEKFIDNLGIGENCQNSIITVKFIDKPWNWSKLSTNSIITIKFVENL
jgi:hypothetical protein